MTIPDRHRFEATQALRQVLKRAVAWGLLDFTQAKRGVPNPQRRPKEKRPFESRAQVEATSMFPVQSTSGRCTYVRQVETPLAGR